MGSPAGQGSEDERPAHNVKIGQPFAVSKFEVTFSEWAACTLYGRVYCGAGLWHCWRANRRQF